MRNFQNLVIATTLLESDTKINISIGYPEVIIMTIGYFVFIVSLTMVDHTNGARILGWFSLPAKSHHIFIQPIIRGLASQGHQIDFYSSIPMKNPPPNVHVIKLPNLSDSYKGGKQDMKEFGRSSSLMFSNIMYQTGMANAELIASTPEFQKLIHSDEKYDLVIGEFLFVNEDATTLMHKFKVPGVALQPQGECAWVNEIAGLPDNPSYMIDFKSLFTDQMSFFQRLYNIYTTMITIIVSYYFVTFPMQEQMDRHFNYTGWETRPKLPMLVADLALILINSHHSVGYSYPKAPHVKEVGGVNIVPNQPLPKDLLQYMDEANDGVIYFSLGSVVEPIELMKGGAFEEFVKVFKKLKQRVLWKWQSGVELPKVDAANIKFSPWFPQQDILAHKNTILFITHGGLLSMTEAVNYGVPLVGIGVFGDQLKNVIRMDTVGFGVKLDLDDMTEASISKAIATALQPKYKREILRRQALFKDRPMKPIDEAVYWIEYVLKHGKVLQPASARMPFYQLYMLDVLGVLGLASLLLLFIARIILRSLRSLWSRKLKQTSGIKRKQQ